LAGCSPKQKREKTGKKGSWLHQSIGQLLSQTKKGEDRKERLLLAMDHGIDPLQKKEKGTGKETQEAVNCPTTLPNKKGEDRKERPLLGILIIRLILSKKNRKGWQRGSQWADCYPKQKREKTGKKDCQLGRSLD